MNYHSSIRIPRILNYKKFIYIYAFTYWKKNPTFLGLKNKIIFVDYIIFIGINSISNDK